VRQLPELHAVAIRLRDEGFDHQVIAVALGIEVHEVPVLLRIADSKLAHLINAERSGQGPIPNTRRGTA